VAKRSEQSLTDERRRKRLRREIQAEIDLALEKATTDGLTRLRGLTDEEWGEAAAADEANVGGEEESA